MVIKLIPMILLFTMINKNTSIAQSFEVVDIGKEYLLDSSQLITGMYYHIEDRKSVIGGNTSIRNETAETLVWKGNPSENGFGYFQRNRDLGQIFNVSEGVNVLLKALVLRTSKGNNAVMKGAPGAKMYVNLYEVVSTDEELSINDNYTGVGHMATHGFDRQLNRCDDYIVGDRYQLIQHFSGGYFPEISPTDQYVYDRGKGEPYGEQPGHLRFIKFVFDKDLTITLQSGKRYAFLVGFYSEGPHRGIALAIHTKVHDKKEAAFVHDANGKIVWGIRREGSGDLPPTMVQNSTPPEKRTELYSRLINESLFSKNHISLLAPTSNGYPDVDTYRTLQYYLEVEELD